MAETTIAADIHQNRTVATMIVLLGKVSLHCDAGTGRIKRLPASVANRVPAGYPET